MISFMEGNWKDTRLKEMFMQIQEIAIYLHGVYHSSRIQLQNYFMSGNMIKYVD